MDDFAFERRLHRGHYIPADDIIGNSALNTMHLLQRCLNDPSIGRIAIVGRDGVGKTFLMKHLHNFALNLLGVERFDYVIWVSLGNDECSIEDVQDAIAAALKCDISDTPNKAHELSRTLGDLGRFVLLLDGLTKSDVPESVEEILGCSIPAHGDGIECNKLVVTSNCTASDSESRMLDSFTKVEVGSLTEKEAFELFKHEAGLDDKSVAVLDNIPKLLVKECGGVPRRIVNWASRMYGVDDIFEWRNALFQLPFMC
ncbi:unnamed protein product [Amaranthus hypochondriacus]